MPTALDAVHAYYRAFSTLDSTVIAACFTEPCLSVGVQGVFTAPNRAALAAAFLPILEGLRAKGYVQSEFTQAQVTRLADFAELVQGVAVRYGAAETELERIPLSYLMQRTQFGWQIAVMVLSS